MSDFISKKASNLPFDYTIKRHPQSTRLRISVSHQIVQAIAPPQFATHRIHQFVIAKQDWIIKTLSQFAEKKAQQTPIFPLAYSNSSIIPYLGGDYPLAIQFSQSKRIKIEFLDGFIVHLPVSLAPEFHNSAIQNALEIWLKKQAYLLTLQLVDQHAKCKQLIPRSIHIRSQKTRWGSCGIRNDIQINWLLIFSPIEVLEYVVVHELCHIREKNHSQSFWALVAWHLPDYQQPRLWLKQNGQRLMSGIEQKK